MRVGVLFSGRGMNLKSIIERSLRLDSQYTVDYMITDNFRAPGRDYACDYSIQLRTLYNPSSRPWQEWEEEVAVCLREFKIDLVVLAGFMRILHRPFCSEWEGRCLNIHPSLLPKYKGLHTHQRALKAGDDIHGCSVHFVTPELDDGPIVAQERVNIYPSDTEQSLATRVLEREVLLYPEVIQCIASGRITISDNKILFNRNTIESPLSLNELL